jgi:hypothetical protein
MFVFGFLKFFQPFRGWFDIQIQQSHLPHQAILAGKLAEMVTACLFLLPWLRRSSTAKYKDQLLLIACAMLVSQMVVAIYVHLQTQVSANVLPLGIKPPVIPFVSPPRIAHCFCCLEEAARRLAIWRLNNTARRKRSVRFLAAAASLLKNRRDAIFCKVWRKKATHLEKKPEQNG